ncbi:hypothetical protein EDD16DRAFT_1522200 [Pisolithus croceorrhizus]|nr:hypothetical protein EDD16DRAFT_1522200 [Pisolithus croceorrhizus]KAI6111891.1 hypothetical protein EV401DRAFT_2211843 [Pisolithus croceorrhizus]KAI6163952.1 hypothetical protein EDD17DRAFT_406449 [Pisolithus thermaeus]
MNMVKAIFLRQRSPSSQGFEGIKEGCTNGSEHVGNMTLQRVTCADYDISSRSQEDSSPDTNSEDDAGSDTDIGINISEEAETISAHHTLPPRPSSRDAKEEDVQHPTKAWYEFDLAVMIALASGLGNWLTGGDYVKDAILLLLLLFYLHQIIEVPWSLYHSCRPRRPSYPQSGDASTKDRYAKIASSELRAFEMFYLALTVLSPLLGTLLLHFTFNSLSGPGSISWFSSTLFVLATGYRPWSHLVSRLRQRITDLHDMIHYPPSDIEKTQEHLKLLTEKVALLETQLKASQARLGVVSNEIYEDVKETCEVTERSVRRQEKKSEAVKNAHEARLSRLEKDVELLLEWREIHADAVSPTLLSWLQEHIKIFKPYWMTESPRATSPSRSRSYSKSSSCRSPPTSLETIPERAAFQPATRVPSSRFRIPGLKLLLDIGDLVTLPLRYLIACLFSGKVFSLRGSALFP